MAKRTTKPGTAAVAPAPPELETEIANRLRDPFETNYMGVVRTNDPLLLERGDGSRAFELYRDLKRDGKVFSGLQKRKLAVIAKPWQVEPIEEGPAGERDAKIVTKILKRMGFDKLCDELLDALLVGFVPAEIVWAILNNLVAPARVVKRAQRRFVYVQDDAHAAPALHLLTQANMLKGEVVPERKFIVHRVNPEDDNPYGTGLGLQLYWPVFFKRKGILSWNKLNDRFGSPTPWGKYPRNAGPKEKGTLFDALKALSNDGVMMTPDGMAIELLESKLTGSITTQQNLCEYMDDWIMEVILGQSPRGKGGGAMAASSNEREDVRVELSQADSDLLSETLNETLLKWICEYNGLTQCQVYRVIKKAEDLKAASETDKNVSEMGFKMTVAGVKAKYGEHWEEATTPAPAPAPGTGPGVAGKPAAPASFAEPGTPPAAQPDALDKLIDEELAQWQPVMAPMVDPIRKLLADAAARGQTAAELLARLPELLAQMDADPLADSLTRTAFAARLGADAGIEND